nr:small integral membrane protein 24 isoform X2 [Globicephala melas]
MKRLGTTPPPSRRDLLAQRKPWLVGLGAALASLFLIFVLTLVYAIWCSEPWDRQPSRDAPVPSPCRISKDPALGPVRGLHLGFRGKWPLSAEDSGPAPSPSWRALCVLPGRPVPLPKLGLHLMILLELGGHPWHKEQPPPRDPLLSHISTQSASLAAFGPFDFFSHLRFLLPFGSHRRSQVLLLPTCKLFREFSRPASRTP